MKLFLDMLEQGILFYDIQCKIERCLDTSVPTISTPAILGHF